MINFCCHFFVKFIYMHDSYSLPQAWHAANVKRYLKIDKIISNTPGDIHGPHPMAEGVPSVPAKNKKHNLGNITQTYNLGEMPRGTN